jgi:hypothetical protein
VATFRCESCATASGRVQVEPQAGASKVTSCDFAPRLGATTASTPGAGKKLQLGNELP